MRHTVFICLMLLLTGSIASASCDPEFQRRVIDLGGPANGCGTLQSVQALSINEHGEVAGQVVCFVEGSIASSTAFIWLPEPNYGLPAKQFITLPGEDCSGANHISDNGIVVGWAGDCTFPLESDTAHAAVWTLSASPTLLLLAPKTIQAFGVNEAEPQYQVVGEMEKLVGATWGFLWTEGGDPSIVSEITPIGGWSDAGALAINNEVNAQIAGWGDSCDFDDTSCIYASCLAAARGDAIHWIETAGKVTHARTLPQPLEMLTGQGEQIGGAAVAINDNGNLVGWGFECFAPHGKERALYWPYATAPAIDVVNLGALVPGAGSGDRIRAYSINEGLPQKVVGVELLEQRALYWQLDPQTQTWCFVDLQEQVNASIGWDLRAARGVNDDGWICGYGSHGGEERAFLLVPHPNPGCVADTDQDGDIDVDDLLAVILQWGDTCVTCSGDVTLDGLVDVNDLVKIITSWGICPGSGAQQPLTLEAELALAGLTSEDWDLLMNNLEDENHRCWMQYHLSGSGGSCPGSDPYN